MAILTATELAELRRGAVVRLSPPINFNKSEINLALQAMEDWYEAEKATVVGLINTATAPFVFTNLQKKAIAISFLQQKFRREDA